MLCSLSVVRCLLYVADIRGLLLMLLLFGVSCMLFVVDCWSLLIVCVGCSLLFVVGCWPSFVVRCSVCVVCCT